MAPHVPPPEDLVLHGPHVVGFALTAHVAGRYWLDGIVAESSCWVRGQPAR